jgi:hypothetical protein
VIWHNFDCTIFQGFNTITPFSSAQQPISSSAIFAHSTVRQGLWRQGNVKHLNLANDTNITIGGSKVKIFLNGF